MAVNVATRTSTTPTASAPAATKPKQAAPPPPLDSVVYWGFNPTNGVEIKALDAASKLDPPVTVVTNPTPDSTVITFGGKSFDLERSSELSAFTRAVGVADPANLAGILNGITGRKRVDAARFAIVMAEGEAGTRDVRRLVLSGHSAANRIWGDNASDYKPGFMEMPAILSNGMGLRDIMNVAKCFPKAAGKVEHLMMSACSSGFAEELDLYRATFPGLASITAWAGASPASTKTHAPGQLGKWLKATEHGKAKDIDPSLFGGAKGFTGRNAITWNKVDGYQGPSYAEARAVVDAVTTMPPLGKTLDRYYFALMHVIYSAEFETFPADVQDKMKQTVCDALALRHPEVAPLHKLGLLKGYL